MKSATKSVALASPKSAAFEFLSHIANLPKWATMFCRELKQDAAGRHKVVTPGGEIFFRVVADKATGVIDMYGGPTEAHMAHWPTRVIDLPGGGSMFLFSAIQYPGMSDADFAAQCDGVEKEFVNIKACVDGVRGPASR